MSQEQLLHLSLLSIEAKNLKKPKSFSDNMDNLINKLVKKMSINLNI